MCVDFSICWMFCAINYIQLIKIILKIINGCILLLILGVFESPNIEYIKIYEIL